MKRCENRAAGGGSLRRSWARTRSSSPYDLIVVGSGATGGWVAKRAAEAGLRVALVEAGRSLDDADYREHVAASDLPYRGRTERPLTRLQPQQSQSYACDEWNSHFFVDDLRSRTSPATSRSRGWGGRGWWADAPTSGAVRATGSAISTSRRPSHDGHRRELADRLRGPGALLRHRRTLRRHLRAGRGSPGAARWRVSAADADDLRGASRCAIG